MKKKKNETLDLFGSVVYTAEAPKAPRHAKAAPKAKKTTSDDQKETKAPAVVPAPIQNKKAKAKAANAGEHSDAFERLEKEFKTVFDFAPVDKEDLEYALSHCRYWRSFYQKETQAADAMILDLQKQLVEEDNPDLLVCIKNTEWTLELQYTAFKQQDQRLNWLKDQEKAAK